MFAFATRGREHIGGGDSAVAQFLLVGAAPALVADADTAQVHHGVRVGQRGFVEAPVLG